ncbi:trehalose-phosphatase [Pseudaminobacter sp. 19-2017]|uniref:Trehalose 6-phosphate phosphatase n=1 Tax=Pseudaminobacter soli (ex Zhang et al. 2022) TaxID=2831468 RepID=A0A942EBS0_9HYPH|nr:trehalose-phosphatase [Pseudaminobacter soli]MBS3652212.1 trehalose-phosphatase [Pseudaminobacter soli]
MRSLPPSPTRPFALFLDIDGTLIEHQPNPEGISVDPVLRELLISAGEAVDGALAFITGRTIAMVDRVFRPLELPVAGLYGLEHRMTPGGEIEAADEPEDMRAVADALEREFAENKGIYFERKGPVLAIHTRAAPEALERVKTAAEAALPSLSDGYRIVVGNAGLEFLPVNAMKSAAIDRFMQIEPFADRFPVFIGDDVSDESGFSFVNELGGMSIRVRPRGETEARYVLPDVAAVREWLAEQVLPERRARKAG